MHSRDFPSILIIIYVLTDELVSKNTPPPLKGKVGAKHTFRRR